MPSGTIIASPNNTTVTVSGSSNTIVTQAGATVTVPASATGPATNRVTTGAAVTASDLTTAAPQVTVLAGSATTNIAPTDGTGTAAVFWGRGRIVVDPVSGNLLVSDRGALREVTQAGQVTTLDQSVDWEGLAMDTSGNVYGSGQTYGAWGSVSLVKRTPAGVIQTLAPNWATSSNVEVTMGGLAVDAAGNVYAADPANRRIVRFTPSGDMAVFAGSGADGSADGTGTAASFTNPVDLAIDPAGNLWVADGANGVRRISPSGTVTTAKAGMSVSVIAADHAGNVYIVYNGFFLARIDAAGNQVTYGDVASTVGASFISSLATDSNGTLYADSWGLGAQILKITFN